MFSLLYLVNNHPFSTFHFDALQKALFLQFESKKKMFRQNLHLGSAQDLPVSTVSFSNVFH